MEAINEKLSRGGVLRIDPATIQNVRQGTEMVATLSVSSGGHPELLSISGNDDAPTGFVTVDLTNGNSYELIDEMLATANGNVCSTTARLVAAMKCYQNEILSRQATSEPQ